MALPPLTYNQFVSTIATLAVVNVQTTGGVVVGNGDPAFDQILPQLIANAEGRIQRDLDLQASVTSRSYTLTSGSNLLQVPTGDFVTLQTIETATGPLLPVTKEFLQNCYGSGSTQANPLYFAMYGGDLSTGGTTSNNVIVGPVPDSNYPITVTGTVRLPSLNDYNTAPDAGTKYTFISQYLPDLFVQAGMVLISEYQRNFGAISNAPEMGPTYEANYNNLLRGAIAEEYRKKFAGSAWSSMSQPIGATTGR